MMYAATAGAVSPVPQAAPERLHAFTTDASALDPLAALLGSLEAAEQMQRRAVEDMLTRASAAHWERRAAEFEAAIPRADDFHGNATPEQITERAIRCKESADQCRAHAKLLRGDPLA